MARGVHVEELIVHRVLIVPVRLRSELRVQQVLVGRVIDEAKGAVGVADHVVDQVTEPRVVCRHTALVQYPANRIMQVCLTLGYRRLSLALALQMSGQSALRLTLQSRASGSGRTVEGDELNRMEAAPRPALVALPSALAQLPSD